MKLSLSWIGEYVTLPADLDLKKLAYDLTMSTVEVEDVEYLARRFDKMVVGVINSVEPHPNADKLRVCKVDLGGDVKEIVCGGINLQEGMRVAVACPGAMVRWHGEGEPVEIKNSKLRGVASYGMICASDEIGLGDLFPASQEAEILDLSAFDAPAGTPLAEALDLDDVLLEIDNKSMTNRPDLWGHYGIARELAALYNLPLKKIEPYQPEVQSDFKVEIDDPDRCTRYIGVEMSGVSVKPSPYKMQSRIWKAGMRPINALVDITNYVMLATGNPTHALTPTTSPITSLCAAPPRARSLRCSTRRSSSCARTISSSPTPRALSLWQASWAERRIPSCPRRSASFWKWRTSNRPASAARRCATTRARRLPPAMKRPSTRSAAIRLCLSPCSTSMSFTRS